MRELTTSGAAEDVHSSSLKVILESESWRFISTKAYFGVFNLAKEPRKFTLKITEIEDVDMLPSEL